MAAQGFCGTLSNKTCQVCSSSEATHYCDCQDPSTLFCLDCSILHSRKNPSIVHQTIPLAALGRNLEDFKRKHKELMKGATELRKNVERIDECCNEFDEMIKRCANYLAEYRNWWHSFMQREKEELSAAIEEAVLETITCLNQNLAPKSRLAWALWTLLPEEMQVVSCSVTEPDLRTPLQSCTSFLNNLQALCERGKPVEEASSAQGTSLTATNAHIPPQDTRAVQSTFTEEAKFTPAARIPLKIIPTIELAQVTSTFLRMFNTSAWGPQVRLSTRIQVDEGSTWVILEDGRLFCSGGGEEFDSALSVAYFLDRDGGVEKLPDMFAARSYHGVIQVINLFIFGGCNL